MKPPSKRQALTFCLYFFGPFVVTAVLCGQMVVVDRLWGWQAGCVAIGIEGLIALAIGAAWFARQEP